MNRRRTLMALLAGSGAALATLSVPVPLIEMLVSSTGLAEAMPAAAPPLGFTAQAAMAGFAGLLGVGAALALQSRGASQNIQDERDAGEPDEGEDEMGFALSKLTTFTRGRGRKQAVTGLEAIAPMPVLRRADSHPDAPARRPIFASRDFGGTEPFTQPLPVAEPDMLIEPETPFIEAPFIEPEEPLMTVEEIEGLAMPRSPAPMDEHALLVEAIEAQAHAAPASKPTIARPPLDGLSIRELVDRFEQGIARRKALVQAAAAAQRIDGVRAETGDAPAAPFADAPFAGRAPMLADIPPASPVAVRSDVDQEVDEALRAALSTLQRMTGR